VIADNSIKLGFDDNNDANYCQREERRAMNGKHRKARAKRLRTMGLGLLVAELGMLTASLSVQATPHTGQSTNVVFIGGSTLDTNVPCAGWGPEANNMGATAGGCLPVTGNAGELGDFSFAAMIPGNVSATALAPFDTAVLNVASSAMACNTNTLTVAQQAALVNFVAAGKKLIIFDSECRPQDYSWLPFPFTTRNPGALGARGTLTVVEDNFLSTKVGDPSCSSGDAHCIDVQYLGGSTDSVGDMNVMTTFDPNWCLDLSGTNAIGVTGPVHTYAKYPAGADDGLIIYNGLDQDYQGFSIAEANLRKLWVQELQQPFSPSNLPCGVAVVGITLSPADATNLVGQEHTVTATLKDQLATPQPNVVVNFSIVTGPNAGLTGIDATNAQGEASFTYSSGTTGTDQIKACFTNSANVEVCSQRVTKTWTTTALTCMGIPATITGTAGDDVIRGTDGRDVIAGLGGNDTIYGLAGDDVICGGTGNDTIYGGGGNDKIYGGPGTDKLFGGSGNDIVSGGPGNDKCDGGTNTTHGDVARGCKVVVNVP
jgi:hypothetical protein